MGQTVPNPESHDQPRGPMNGARAGLAGPDAAQVASVAAWLRWHAVELAGIGVPLTLGVLVSVWFVALAVPAAGLWAAHETRQRSQVRAAERAALTSSDSCEENE